MCAQGQAVTQSENYLSPFCLHTSRYSQLAHRTRDPPGAARVVIGDTCAAVIAYLAGMYTDCVELPMAVHEPAAFHVNVMKE
jgi:hypothetical protein